MKHKDIERNIGLMGILIVVAISIGGLVEIVPLMMLAGAQEPAEGIKPYSALRLEGRDVYVSEGCYVCHSQQIRPFRSETERYGHYSVAGEFVYDRPFQFGSKRTGPDLARVGQRYTDEWHRVHLINPRDLVPESNMPGYPWLEDQMIDPEGTVKKLRALQMLGDPYTDEEVMAAASEVEGRSKMDALIAYLQGLGVEMQTKR